ncbi:hypothetical protein PV326_006983 [Microctonus aethiopoides]|nr:hypothetical protein PV326_006983 [Microctonus aethiopoides]
MERAIEAEDDAAVILHYTYDFKVGKDRRVHAILFSEPIELPQDSIEYLKLEWHPLEPYIDFTYELKLNIYIPMEWLQMNTSYEFIIEIVLKMTAEYANRTGTHAGCVINYNNIKAGLYIDVSRRMWWYRRILMEDDPRPPTIHYYPPIAPPELEEEWFWWLVWGGNNVDNDNENNDNENENNNDDNDDIEMILYFLQNWMSDDDLSNLFV